MQYKVFLTTKVKPSALKKGSGIIVIEPEDYKKADVKAIKAKGYKVLAYLSVGSLETGDTKVEKALFEKYSRFKLKRLENWPKEYYMDVRKTQWINFVVRSARAIKESGYDGWWLDNIDVYSEYKSKAMKTAIASVLSKIKALKGYVMINGGSEWIDDMIDNGEKLTKYLDGYTQEEVFTRILDYDGKGKFGKQKKADRVYYQGLIKKLEKRKVNCFLLEYTKDKALKEKILKWCKENGVDQYISEDVDL